MNEHAHSLRTPAPWHLWLVGIAGLLFNSAGAFDYVMMQTRSDSYLARFTPAHIDIIRSLPAWLVASWAVAVWAGTAGAILLLLRSRFAVPVLLASLVGMSVTAVHNAASSNGLYETAGTGTGFVLVIFALALGLVLYARAMDRRGMLTRRR